MRTIVEVTALPGGADVRLSRDLRPWGPGPDLLDLLEGLAEVGEPFLLPLAHQADAPCQRVAP